MPQSLSSLLVHLVFSTKHREPRIVPSVERDLHRYMATIFRNQKCPSLTIGGTTDHLHALFVLSRTDALCDVVEVVKKDSSKWIKTQGGQFSDFHWQLGYGAFSIGQSNVSALKQYIAKQKEHHAKRSFQSEYRTLLRRYGVPFDERYVWD